LVFSYFTFVGPVEQGSALGWEQLANFFPCCKIPFSIIYSDVENYLSWW